MSFGIWGWKFDPITAIVTLVVAPFGVYAVLALRRHFSHVARHLLDGILQAVSQVATQRIAATLSLRRYSRLQLAGQNRFLNVPGIVEINLEIDEIFVPLTLERAGTSRNYSHSDILGIGDRIRIVGDPGSGKSSVAKRLFRDECKKTQNGFGSDRLPMFVELRRLNIPANASEKGLGDWFLKTLVAAIKKLDVYEAERCFNVYASTKGLLIILDGLDEVSAVQYPRVEKAINALSSRLQELGARNVVVLTMRTQFHQQIRGSYTESFPIILNLKPFSPTDIFDFLTRWPFVADRKEQNIVRIYNDLTDRPTLREMCTNPLILSMYVAQDQASGHRLAPESRTDFYLQITEELLIRRRAKQIGASDAQALLRRQRQRILGQIALEHLCDSEQPANLIPWEHGVSVAAKVLGSDEIGATLLLRDIAKETGLITEEREGETFRFIHLTFCEFLAAVQAIQSVEDGWGNLIRKHGVFRDDARTRTRLAEVVPFAAALLPLHMKPRAVADVGKCADDRTMAMTFYETKTYDHPAWAGFIERYKNALLQVSIDDWNFDWLREVHLFMVVATDADRSGSLLPGVKKTLVVAEFFQFFARLSNESVTRLIASYAEKDAAAAFRIATFCGIDLLETLPEIVVQNADQPPFLAIAVQRASEDVGKSERWACVFAEAGLRSAAAAALLSNKTDRPWMTNATAVPVKHRWSLPRFLPESFYSDCLTLSHASKETALRGDLLLNHFRRLTFPKLNVVLRFHARFITGRLFHIFCLWYLLLALPVMAPVFLGLVGFHYDEVRPYVRFLSGGLLAAYAGALLVAVGGFVYLERRCRLYSAVTNINFSGRDVFTLPFRVWMDRILTPRPIECPPAAKQFEALTFVRSGRVFLGVRSEFRGRSRSIVSPVAGEDGGR